MRQNSKIQLAVNAMVDLALREWSGPVPLVGIANRQRVCLSRLELLFARLRLAGLVQSTRGPGGGYTLGREAAAISVAAIAAAVEIGAPDARAVDGRPSLTDDLAKRLDAAMQAHMADIALADLVAGRREPVVTAKLRPSRSAVVPRPPMRRIAAGVPNSVFALGTAMAMAGANSSRR